MRRSKNKINKILKFISFGILFICSIFELAIKGNRINFSKFFKKENYSIEKISNSTQIKENLIYSHSFQEILEKTENDFVFDEYTNKDFIECLFVGCGGFF